jgi:hypothetical protein
VRCVRGDTDRRADCGDDDVMTATRIEVPNYMRRYADEYEAWHAAKFIGAWRKTLDAGIVNGADPRAAKAFGRFWELSFVAAAPARCN